MCNFRAMSKIVSKLFPSDTIGKIDAIIKLTLRKPSKSSNRVRRCLMGDDLENGAKVMTYVWGMKVQRLMSCPECSPDFDIIFHGRIIFKTPSRILTEIEPDLCEWGSLTVILAFFWWYTLRFRSRARTPRRSRYNLYYRRQYGKAS